jgi:hypothetical protein
MGRYLLIGLRLRARGFAARRTEAVIDVAALNRMLAALSAVKQSLRRKFGSGYLAFHLSSAQTPSLHEYTTGSLHMWMTRPDLD